jgi:hypothetical protein
MEFDRDQKAAAIGCLAISGIGGWVGPRAGPDGCGKSRPTRIRSPGCPAPSYSLYRLSFPGPHSAAEV